MLFAHRVDSVRITPNWFTTPPLLLFYYARNCWDTIHVEHFRGNAAGSHACDVPPSGRTGASGVRGNGGMRPHRVSTATVGVGQAQFAQA